MRDRLTVYATKSGAVRNRRHKLESLCYTIRIVVRTFQFACQDVGVHLKSVGEFGVIKPAIKTERCRPSGIGEHARRINDDLSRAIG